MSRRIFAAIAGSVIVVVLVVALFGRNFALVAEQQTATIRLEQQAFRLALDVQDDLEGVLTPGQVRSLDGRAAAFAGRHPGIGAVLADRSGVVVAAAGTAGARVRAMADRIAADDVRRGSFGARHVRVAGEAYELVTVPIRANEGRVGTVLLVQRSSAVAAATEARRRLFTLAFVIGVGLAVVLALVLARLLTRPLDQLVQASRGVARDGGAAPHVELRGPPEVQELGAAFNTMSERVGDLVERQSRFASDVSHQLRTPLTTIRLGLDRMQERHQAGDAEGARECYRSTRREAARLQHLVEGLLALTRMSLRDAPRTEVDVADVVRQRADSWRDLAVERGVDLAVEAPDRLVARAVPGAVDQILDNLIDNALEVAPAGSALDLTAAAEARGDGVVLKVRDRGPGLSAEEQQRAFDRFWRGDGASDAGIGIGLTIVHDLVTACGGSVALRTPPGGGLEVVIVLGRRVGEEPAKRAAWAVAALDPRRRRVRHLAATSGIGVAVVVLLLGGVATANGDLPDPLQRRVADLLARVGVAVPVPDGSVTGEADEVRAGHDRSPVPTARVSEAVTQDLCRVAGSDGTGAAATAAASARARLRAAVATVDCPGVDLGDPASASGRAGAPTSSGSAPGQSGSSPGSSGSAPGQNKTAPGSSGTAPGQSGTSPGSSGSAPGQNKTPPGQSGGSPGSSGSAPGQNKTPPGQAKKNG